MLNTIFNNNSDLPSALNFFSTWKYPVFYSKISSLGGMNINNVFNGWSSNVLRCFESQKKAVPMRFLTTNVLEFYSSLKEGYKPFPCKMLNPLINQIIFFFRISLCFFPSSLNSQSILTFSFPRLFLLLA